MRKLCPLAIAFVSLSLLAPAPAQASHNSPLYQAACEYRDAVRHFERAVIRAPYFDRYQERIVDDLEDATSPLRTWARHPHYFDRFLAAWRDVQFLQPRVEAAIFGRPGCPVRGEVVTCWERVTCAYDRLAEQIAGCGSGYGHHHPVPTVRYPSNRVPTFPYVGNPYPARTPNRTVTLAVPQRVIVGNERYQSSYPWDHRIHGASRLPQGHHHLDNANRKLDAQQRTINNVIRIGAMLSRAID